MCTISVCVLYLCVYYICVCTISVCVLYLCVYYIPCNKYSTFSCATLMYFLYNGSTRFFFWGGGGWPYVSCFQKLICFSKQVGTMKKLPKGSLLRRRRFWFWLWLSCKFHPLITGIKILKYQQINVYCCTVHVVTIISFIPTHAQFYTL